jgi:mRNA-degrading endonuclease RelE of RelBE toxin-antitoxin system
VDVRYRESFLRDLKKLKKLTLYSKIFTLAFQTLPNAATLTAVPGVKAMAGHSHRYRVRVGSYRVGMQVDGPIVELIRVLDRRDFYRYFP